MPRSRLLASVLAVAIASTPAHAEETAKDTVEAASDPSAVLVRVRAHFAAGEFDQARTLLVDAYARAPRTEFLFALGQVEFNLGNYSAAIDYYERFLATSPDAEQSALAQQAIGAARAQLAIQRDRVPAPPPVRRVRDWDVTNTGLVVLGGAAIVLGAGLIVFGQRLDDDRSGTLRDYDHRLDQAITMQWSGVACGAVGALVIGAALVRYGIRRVDERTIVQPIAGPGTVGLALERRW